MDALTDDVIVSELSPYGAVVSHSQCDSIRAYIDLLLRWNRVVSLTTVSDVSDILRFHIGESIFAIASGLISKGRLADVGSGAGLPGVPLALFSGKLDVTLIESNAKKAAFLGEIARTLRLNNIRVIRDRFERVQAEVAFDFIVTRALGQYESLLRWSSRELAATGHLVLWLGLRDAQDIARNPRWSWQSPRNIPASTSRVILIGQR